LAESSSPVNISKSEVKIILDESERFKGSSLNFSSFVLLEGTYLLWLLLTRTFKEKNFRKLKDLTTKGMGLLIDLNSLDSVLIEGPGSSSSSSQPVGLFFGLFWLETIVPEFSIKR